MALAFFEGLAYSGLYALLGLGFYLAFGVLKRLDLAFGTVIMASVYVAAMVAGQTGHGLVVFPLAWALCVLLGIAVGFVAFRLVRGDARYSMAATLGIWMALEELVLQGPGQGRGLPVANPWSDVVVSIGTLGVRADHLAALAIALVLAAAVHALLTRTRAGLAIRVTAHDPQVAQLLGLSPSATALLATVLAASVGAVAGSIFAAAQSAIDVHFGMWATSKGLVILVLGGFAGVRGIVAAALGLGVAERLGTEFIGTGYRDLIGYGLMVALLATFPRGLARGMHAGG